MTRGFSILLNGTFGLVFVRNDKMKLIRFGESSRERTNLNMRAHYTHGFKKTDKPEAQAGVLKKLVRSGNTSNLDSDGSWKRPKRC